MKAVLLVLIVTGVVVIKFQNRRRFFVIVPMEHRTPTNAPAMVGFLIAFYKFDYKFYRSDKFDYKAQLLNSINL